MFISLTSKYLNRTTFSSIVLPLVHSIIQFNSLQIVSFAQSDNTGAIDVKTDGSIRWKKSSFKMLGLSFSSKLDCGFCIISIGKTAFKKTALIPSMEFFSPGVALYLYKSTIQPCMEYYCHVWARAPSC